MGSCALRALVLSCACAWAFEPSATSMVYINPSVVDVNVTDASVLDTNAVGTCAVDAQIMNELFRLNFLTFQYGLYYFATENLFGALYAEDVSASKIKVFFNYRVFLPPSFKESPMRVLYECYGYR